MSKSVHATYTAVDRFGRRAQRRQRPVVRRQHTRSAVVLAALKEV